MRIYWKRSSKVKSFARSSVTSRAMNCPFLAMRFSLLLLDELVAVRTSSSFLSRVSAQSYSLLVSGRGRSADLVLSHLRARLQMICRGGLGPRSQPESVSRYPNRKHDCCLLNRTYMHMYRTSWVYLISLSVFLVVVSIRAMIVL